MYTKTVVNRAAPDLEKALSIARDVLDRLNERQYVTGSYGRGLMSNPNKIDIDTKDVINQVEEGCNVCLLGSCLLSKARVYNALPLFKITMPDCNNVNTRISIGVNVVFSQLEPIFGEFELCKLESFFEQRNMADEYDLPDLSNKEEDLINGAAYAGSQIKDNRDRVRSAMENFITNNGVLTVDPRPEDQYGRQDFYDDDFDDDDEDLDDEEDEYTEDI